MLENTLQAETLAKKAQVILRAADQMENFVDTSHLVKVKILNPLALSVILKEHEELF